jgi:hypothetical protein
MAERGFWSRLGGPGLAGFVTRLRERLRTMDLGPRAVERLMGENIATRLARPLSHSGRNATEKETIS